MEIASKCYELSSIEKRNSGEVLVVNKDKISEESIKQLNRLKTKDTLFARRLSDKVFKFNLLLQRYSEKRKIYFEYDLAALC